MKAAPLLACLVLSGCALIDQNTFAPSPEATLIAATPTPIRIDLRTPLLLIDYAGVTPRYQDLLRVAVQAAEARGRAVQYDVIAVMPKLPDAPPPQVLEVMRAMTASGVPAARLHLGLRVDPALPALQVRVYVR